MKPFKFKYNRVRRSYTGGQGIDAIRGISPAVDGEYPEEWIASAVKAFPRPDEPEDAGLSIIADDSGMTFADLLESHSEELLGKKHMDAFGKETGFLMKMLDSSIRLPLQVHPDNEKAIKLFNSFYGKTEAWLILATRPVDGEKPYLLIGFNEQLDKDVFIRESIDGVLRDSLDMMHKVEVEPGDLFMIRGGLPHALGAGLTVIEIMEPSDWIAVSEKYCGDIVIDDTRRFNGIEPELAMSMYDFTPVSLSEVKNYCCLKNVKIDPSLTRLINRDELRYFGLERLDLNGGWTLVNTEECCRAGIVISGSAVVDSELTLNSGDTFFLPATCNNVEFKGIAQIIMALPPVVNC